MKPIEKTAIWKIVEKIMSWILVIFSALLVIVITLAVFMRYVMNSTLFGNEEILALLAIWVYWIGGAYGSYEDSHISADMTDLFFKSEKLKHSIRVVIRAVTVFITGCFAYWACTGWAVRNLTLVTYTTGLRIPKYTSQLALTVAFVLMFLYAIYHLYRAIRPLKEDSDVKGGDAV